MLSLKKGKLRTYEKNSSKYNGSLILGKKYYYYSIYPEGKVPDNLIIKNNNKQVHFSRHNYKPHNSFYFLKHISGICTNRTLRSMYERIYSLSEKSFIKKENKELDRWDSITLERLISKYL